jgi:hypothetical protein
VAGACPAPEKSGAHWQLRVCQCRIHPDHREATAEPLTTPPLDGGSVIGRDQGSSGSTIEIRTDEERRIHGSGANEPGRNFVVTAELRF